MDPITDMYGRVFDITDNGGGFYTFATQDQGTSLTVQNQIPAALADATIEVLSTINAQMPGSS